MTATLPAYRYRDPAEVAAIDEIRDMRVIDGCMACNHRHGQTYRCRINRAPPIGQRHCRLWTVKLPDHPTSED